MNYLHIHILLKQTDKKSSRIPNKYMLDKPINEKDTIINDIVKPYINNKPFFFDGGLLHIDEIDELHITTTDKLSEEVLSIAESNRPHGFGVITISDTQYDVVFDPDYAKEITNDFIKEAQANNSNETNLSQIDDLLPHLHDKIREASYQKYKDRHYADAVESAFKEINDRLKKLYRKHKGVEVDGNDLFAKVFNDDPATTLLKVDDLSTGSGKDEQAGYRFLLMGGWSSQRNPKAHANLHITEDEAYDRLILASMLMKRIDKAITFTFDE